LECPGEVVSREILRQRIWPADTFVDFDHGLYNAIKRLREALGDSADQPRYIATISRRGYRFIAPVAGVSQAPAVEQSKHRGWTWPAILGCVVLAALVAFEVLRHRQPLLTSKDTIVVAEITNRTGDPVFDSTLRQAVTIKLQESPFLNVVSDQRMNAVLRLAGRSADATLTPDVAREISQRIGAKAVVTGSILQLSGQFLLVLESLDATTGETLARADREAKGKEQVMTAVGSAAIELRRKMGESLATLQRFNKPLEEATTPSLEALQAYTRGWKLLLQEGSAEAVPFFQRAIELDPQFAMAYSALGVAYYDLEELGLGAASLRKAFELRDRVSEREKHYVTAMYYSLATGDLQQAATAYELWIAAYPQDAIAHGDLGDLYAISGRYDKAIGETETAIRLDKDLGYAYSNLMSFYLATDRLQEARRVYADATAQNLEARYLHLPLYSLGFLEGDNAAMAREVAWGHDNPGEGDEILALQASTEAYFGRLENSDTASRSAVNLAEREGKMEAAALWLGAQALQEALLGSAAHARQTATAALKIASSRDVEATAAFALARSGEHTRVRVLVKDLLKRFPTDTLTKYVYAPTLRAEIQLNRGEIQQAIEELQSSRIYEFAQPTPASGFVIPIMYPAYVRGEAYLKAHKGHEAVGEFQKIRQHRGLIANSPIGTLALLGLARAHAFEGDTQMARSEFQGFFSTWKNADRDLPIMKEAKAEYMRLR
jgi:eukaryotic-like serine/threonine-protein kinase